MLPSILCPGRATDMVLFLPLVLTHVLWSESFSFSVPHFFTCKMGMLMPILAFLESSQRKICMKVFRRWLKDHTEIRSSFLWLQTMVQNVSTISFASFRFFYFILVRNSTPLSTFLAPQSFKTHPGFISVDLVFYYIYNSYIDSIYFLRFTATSGKPY